MYLVVFFHPEYVRQNTIIWGYVHIRQTTRSLVRLSLQMGRITYRSDKQRWRGTLEIHRLKQQLHVVGQKQLVSVGQAQGL